MLSEWLEPLLTACPPHLRDLGCLREMLGIRRRWRRYRDAWEPHCRRSRELILAAARRCPRQRKAVVYGSGWLHDVPLDELSRLFGEVVLVDLFHPLSIRRRLRRYPNVRPVARDVTGTLEGVYAVVAHGGLQLPKVGPGSLLEEADIDLSVSLNLLSQLPCTPESYLRQWRGVPAEAILAYCRDVVLAHLVALRAAPGVVALITDVNVRRIDRAGQEISRVDTLYGVELPWSGQVWDWTIVPPRRSGRRDAEVLTVVGIEDIKGANRA